MTDFSTLQLPEELAQALTAMDFSTPTPIQAQAIPIALAGKDIIATAQTGTGKTAAFCIPMIARMLLDPEACAVILSPTRELALQTEDVLRKLTRFTPEIRSVLLIGGASMIPQLRALDRGPRIIVATPGRLIDHLERRSVELNLASILVLDEADRMLDMGFAPQLNQILRYLPKVRQTLLFSATFPPEAQKLAGKYLNQPERVTVGVVAAPAPKIRQAAISTSSQEKNNVLLDQLNKREGAVLVFARTKRRTDRIAHYLNQYGHAVTFIHGDRSQGQRNMAIAGFRSGRFRILVATDIAARGLDIPQIAHVINYDLPEVPEDYVHRIGRTARAGADGEAISLVAPEERQQWQRIARLCGIAGVGGSDHGKTGTNHAGKTPSRTQENRAPSRQRPEARRAEARKGIEPSSRWGAGRRPRPDRNRAWASASH